MGKKVIIVGGVAGGATTAARLRRRDESANIILIEKGDYISYANCGLPYYIGGVIKEREALLLQTPQAMKNKYNIDVRISSEVIKIDKNKKTVIIKNHKTEEEYKESYDTLVIATGSSPLKPPIPGINSPNIYTLWTIPDTDMIKTLIEQKSPKRAAIIGGGFIGLEMAENLSKVGMQVTIIEMQNQVMSPIDYEMAQLVHENIEINGVELILKDGVSSFDYQNGETIITLNSKKKIKVDLVLLSIGVRPNSRLAKEAGLKLSQKGAIVVDENLTTSNPDIYAVGDVIEVKDFVLGTPSIVPLAGPANKQARICADNIAGDKKVYYAAQGTSVAKVFDLTVAAVGVNEKTLKMMGKRKEEDYYSVLINQKSHAGYYPNASLITLKMIFDKTGKIYGAQIVGQEGVDKRIDTIATTMRLGGTIENLAELELAYAPPYSSAKDPVNMLGFAAENVQKGLVSFIEWDEADNLLKEEKEHKSFLILDVREDVERMVFSIPGSYHIPLGQLKQRYTELDKDKLIITYCAIGVRSYQAARFLMQNDFHQVKVLSGGTSFYKSMHYLENVEKNLEREEIKIPNKDKVAEKKIKLIDCCSLQCPGPIMKVNEEIKKIKDNEILKVFATDIGFVRDIGVWCKKTGNTLIKTERKDRKYAAYIKKGNSSINYRAKQRKQVTDKKGKTIVVFSGDLDKVLASFIIANGAAAMGRPVTMFFTFWGLNVLRKSRKHKVKKPLRDKMLSEMMPRGAKKLKLSKMNMAGMGTKMMRKVMKDKNVASLEVLIKQAKANHVKLVACTMSMDIMGIKKEELIEGVELAGVASYLSDAEEADVNLFI